MSLNNMRGDRIKIRLSVALLLSFVLLSLWLIFEFAEKERNRDLMSWQSRLALLVEIRKADMEDWIDKRKSQLNQLSSNPGLSLFLSLGASAPLGRDESDKLIEQGQRAHVRNLIRASAERFGFAELPNAVSPVNIEGAGNYGIAILDAQQKLIMSSKGFPTSLEKHQKYINRVFKHAEVETVDLYAGSNQQPVYGYISPVFHIQDNVKKRPVGAVMVLLNPQKSLFGILQNRQTITRTDETLLVKRSGASLEYISPVKGAFKLFHKLPDNNKLAASFAYHTPGGFSVMKDYRGEDVLVTGRKLKNSEWRLVQKISAAEALADSNEHQIFLITTFTLIVLIITAAFIAIWRHSTSVQLQALSQTLEAHVVLLDAVTDNIKENIFLIDEDYKIIFISPVFASSMKLDFDELQGKHLLSVLGKEAADLLLGCQQLKNQECVVSLAISGEKRVYHVSVTLLETGAFKNAQLYVLHDISDLKYEQEKREALSKGIIATLVKAADLHDPYCANHSERTREVAMALGKAMSLPEPQLESLEMASLLANIGKLFVSEEILVKMGDLTEDESSQLKRHIEYAQEILRGLDFNGPVLDIISQKNERLDGKGYPGGLSGEGILLESRILSVANAFVAMASSRAYRKGRRVEEVIDLLVQQTGSQYDRHVVAALFHIAENKAAWSAWGSISKN